MGIVVVSLGAHNASQRARRLLLHERLTHKRGESARRERERKQFDANISCVNPRGVYNLFTYKHDSAILSMLRQCESRDEFVVREGARIAWSELRGSTDRSKKFGIYVPPGRHWLRYGIAFSGNYGHTGYQSFRDGDPLAIDGAVTVELGPEAEVYEFRLNVSDEQPPRIEVLGRDNARIHENHLPVKARGTIFKTSINGGFAFPSEFKPNQEQRPYFLKPEMPPVTDLGFLDGAVKVRLWIESDARPCMPAFFVAAHYSRVTSLRYRHDNPPLIQRVTDPDTEFNRLFEPYDGSLRFYFREGIFRERVLAVSNEGLK